MQSEQTVMFNLGSFIHSEDLSYWADSWADGLKYHLVGFMIVCLGHRNY